MGDRFVSRFQGVSVEDWVVADGSDGRGMG